MQVTTEGHTVRLSGAFDCRSTAEVREAIYRTLRVEQGDVVVDLSGVDSIDLTALRVLVVATRVAGREDRHLILRAALPPVRRMMHLARLRHVVCVEPLAATG